MAIISYYFLSFQVFFFAQIKEGTRSLHLDSISQLDVLTALSVIFVSSWGRCLNLYRLNNLLNPQQILPILSTSPCILDTLLVDKPKFVCHSFEILVLVSMV